MTDAAVPRWSRPAAAWLLVSALLGVAAVAAFGIDSGLLDWQPDAARSQAWRWWSAAFVHFSVLHLVANLLATALVAAYGWAARVPREVTLAWLVAWPLTHLPLWARPELLHYGGLSGVLHAGVAAVTVYLVLRGRGAHRAIGWMMGFGQVIKLLVEQPWGAALHPPTELDVAVAPLAHAAGTLAGALCTVVALTLTRQRRGPGAP